MCGIQPKPVDVRPLQDKVATAANQCNQNDLKALKAQVNGMSQKLDQLCGLVAGAALFQAFKGAFDAQRAPQAPSAGCLQAPTSPELGAAPAGKGITTNPPGWPANSVRTAGGYTVVPEGKDNAWKIYGPQQGPQDKALSRIWGDPHVDEADGQRWDFTKSSTFRLPDGTSIDVGTTSETGRSLSATLNITNGNDRITMSGIDKNAPVLSQVQSDGFAYRAQVESSNPNRDTFLLGGSGREADGNDRVQWARARGGQIEGVVSGTIQNADGKNGYSQTLDRNKQFKIDSSLRPDPVTQQAAWGNLFRGQLADVAAGMPPAIRDLITGALAQADTEARQRTEAQQAIANIYNGGNNTPNVGGLNNVFANPFQGVHAAGRMFHTMFKQLELQNLLGQTLQMNRGLFA